MSMQTEESQTAPVSAVTPSRKSTRTTGHRRLELWAGIGILVTLVLMSVLVTVLRPFSPTEVSGAPFTSPSATHWLGTDDLGRDDFVRLCIAARTSLMISALAATLALIAGSVVGLAAGLQGGRLDTLLMAVVDLVISIPKILVALVAVTVFSPTTKTLVLVLAAVAVPQFARIVRSRCLELREREFVLSARVSGVRPSRIAIRHLVPNVLPIIMVQAANTAAIVILAESALSYLGLGVQPPTPSWGTMVSESQNYMTAAPWMPLAAVGALLLASIGWGLIGEGFTVVRKSAM